MSSSEQEEEYMVEGILDHTLKDGQLYYLIKWQDYSDDNNTWEPYENLNCPDLLKEYQEKMKDKKPVPSKKQLMRKSSTESRKSKNVSSKPQESTSGKRKAASQSASSSSAQGNESKKIDSKKYEPKKSETKKNDSKTNRKEPNEEMVHDGLNEPPNSKDEMFSLVDDSDDDEYETDEDDDYEKAFSTNFEYPETANPIKIVTILSINSVQHFLIQFDDKNLYYIKPEIAKQKCEHLVNKYLDKKGTNSNMVQFGDS